MAAPGSCSPSARVPSAPRAAAPACRAGRGPAPRQLRRYVSDAEADAYVELIRSEGVVRADPSPSPEPLSADPDDEYLIDLARDAQADALVTGDAHLLDLRAIIPAMTPAEFLETLPRP